MNTSNFFSTNPSNRIDPFKIERTTGPVNKSLDRDDDLFSKKLSEKQNDFHNKPNKQDDFEKSDLNLSDDGGEAYRNDVKTSEKKAEEQNELSGNGENMVHDESSGLQDSSRLGINTVEKQEADEVDVDQNATLEGGGTSGSQTKEEEVIAESETVNQSSKLTTKESNGNQSTLIDGEQIASSSKNSTDNLQTTLVEGSSTLENQNSENELSAKSYEQLGELKNIEEENVNSSANKKQNNASVNAGLSKVNVDLRKANAAGGVVSSSLQDQESTAGKEEVSQLEQKRNSQENQQTSKDQTITMNETDLSTRNEFSDSMGFVSGLPEKTLRQSMNGKLEASNEKKQLRKLIRMERDLNQVRVEPTNRGLMNQEASYSLTSLFKKVSDGISDALSKVNLMNFQKNTGSTAIHNKESVSAVEKFVPKNEINQGGESLEGVFKDRTAFSESRDQSIARSALHPGSLLERNFTDQKSSLKADAGKVDVNLQTKDNSNDTNSDERERSFDQSANQFFSQNAASTGLVQAKLVSEVQKKLAPEIIKQIERIRNSEQSWMRLAMDDLTSEPVTLHIRLVEGQVTVRFSDQSNEFKNAVQEMWSGLQDSAKELGVDLTTPQFTQTKK